MKKKEQIWGILYSLLPSLRSDNEEEEAALLNTSAAAAAAAAGSAATAAPGPVSVSKEEIVAKKAIFLRRWGRRGDRGVCVCV